MQESKGHIMKNALLTTTIGAIGIAGGTYIGWLLAKKKYEGLANKEVASVKESLSRYYENLIPKTPAEKLKSKLVKAPTISNTSVLTREIKEYNDYADKYKPINSPERIPGTPEKTKAPYVINPQKFKESGYEQQTLLYFADKVLADEDYNVIHDLPMHIGKDSLEQIGVYEEDSVYVRNDILGIDYEILLDERYFFKVAPSSKIIDIPEED